MQLMAILLKKMKTIELVIGWLCFFLLFVMIVIENNQFKFEQIHSVQDVMDWIKVSIKLKKKATLFPIVGSLFFLVLIIIKIFV